MPNTMGETSTRGCPTILPESIETTACMSKPPYLVKSTPLISNQVRRHTLISHLTAFLVFPVQKVDCVAAFWAKSPDKLSATSPLL